MLLSSSVETPIAFEQVLSKLGEISLQLHQCEDLEAILQQSVEATRELFGSDRALVYHFTTGGDGVVMAESVNQPWRPLGGQLIYDPCFQRHWAVAYGQGRVRAIDDVAQSDLQPCHIEFLTQLQVKANLVAPIVLPPTVERSHPHLWGLLIVQQCSAPRSWTGIHCQVLKQLGSQIGLAMQCQSQQERLTQVQHQAVRWRSALETTAIGIWDWDLLTGRVTFLSHWYTHLDLETDEGGIDFGAWLSQIHPADQAGVLSELEQHFTQQSPTYQNEYRLMTQADSWHWILDQGRVIEWSEQGHPLRMVGTHTDISDRKQMEIAWHEREEKYQTLFRVLPVGVSITDTEGQLLAANPASEDILGMPVSEYLIQGTEAIAGTVIRPDGSPLPINEFACRQAQESHQAVRNMEVGIADGQGGVRWLAVSAAPIPLANYGVAIAYIDITALKQAQARLLVQSRALEASANVIVITDQDGVIEWANPAFTTLTGFSLAEAIGQTPGHLIRSGQQDQAFYELLWQTITSGQVWRGELINRHKDGHFYTEAMTITPVQDTQGHLRHFVAVKQDVTERHRMEQRLRDRDEMLRKISEQVPGVVYQYRLYPDGHACLPYASEAIRHIFEVAPEQVRETAQPLLDRLHPQDRDRVIAHVRRSSQRLELWHAEFRVYLPEKGLRWLEGHAMPEQLPDGSVLWHGYVWDITERKQLQLSLQNREALFRGLFEQAMVGICLVGADQKFLRANQRFCDLMGYRATELSQMTFLEVTHPDDIAKSLVYFRQIMQGQVANACIEKRYIRKNRQVWWANVAVSPRYDKTGKFQYAFGIVVDITDRKIAEARLQRDFQRERMVHLIDHHMRESLDLAQILQTTVQEVRQFLKTDRVLIFQLQPDWTGRVMAESVAPGWLSILNQEIEDAYFVETRGGSYHDNHANVVDDIYAETFSDRHLELLEWLQVRAKLIVPILQGEHLWGLLIAHHCQAPRPWQSSERRLLQQLAGQLAIAIQQSELHHRLQAANHELEQLSRTDALTQVDNRRRFDETLMLEWQRSQRTNQPFALILGDIDHFKQYNDTYGHPVGDACLIAVAQTLQQCLKRPPDCLARYGGEEFAVVLPNTDIEGAIVVVQEMQSAIACLHLEQSSHEPVFPVTMSFGITALLPDQSVDVRSLIAQADQALYQAKARGRDGYVVFTND